jgi:hypothetical protein
LRPGALSIILAKAMDSTTPHPNSYRPTGEQRKMLRRLADGTTVVSIPSITVFKAIAQAVADYAYACDEYANGAPGSSLPIAGMTIA